MYCEVREKRVHLNRDDYCCRYFSSIGSRYNTSFIASEVRHEKAVDLDLAVLNTNAVIEEFQNLNNPSEFASRFTIYFNDDWERSNKDANTLYAIYGDMVKLSDDQEGLLHLDLRTVRLKPYPFEKMKSTKYIKFQ